MPARSSPSSCASSPSQEHPSPPTPYYDYPPAPDVVVLDDLSDSPVPSPNSEPSLMSTDDVGKVRVFLRNEGRWKNMYDRFESSPPRVPLDNARDRFHRDPNVHPFPDSSRCSLLIQEVSLLVGLAPEHDYVLPADDHPAVLDGLARVPDILPLTLTPTKSLAPRKHRNASHSCPTSTINQAWSSDVAIPSAIDPQSNITSASAHEEHPAPVGSADPVTRNARPKCAEVDRLSLSARRRQGRVFYFEPPAGITSRPDALDLDKTFLDPREPPPKPISNSAANRCSSLDRLECSLMKLEAHAPYNHRKSQSDGRAPVRVAQRNDKRPSLPPPRRLKKRQSNHDITHRNTPHLAHDSPLSSHPFPKQMLVDPYDIPRTDSAVSFHENREHNLTPRSFMDMDITCAEEASQQRQTPANQSKNKEKTKGFVGVARRMSRGIIAWGKSLTGSTKS